MKKIFTLLVMLLFGVNFTFAQITFKDLQVDLSITGFQFATEFRGGAKVFTKNGFSDIKEPINPSAFSFIIAPNISANQAKEQLQMYKQLSEQNNYKISDLKTEDITLNGCKAFYISYIVTDNKRDNYKNMVFNAFVIKDKTTIFFISSDNDNGKYIEKLKKTFYNIKL